MTKSIEQVEKDVSASFAYVKKDMLMLNDAFSDIHEKIQHLSMNHAALLEKFERLRNGSAEIKRKSPAKKVTAKRVRKRK